MPKKQATPQTAERVSFLLQAAALGYLEVEDPVMSRSIVQSAMRMVNTSPLRLHPEIKRSICKSCKSLLIPGLTSKVELSQNECVAQTCLICDKSQTAIGTRKNLWNGNGFVSDDWKV